MKKRWSWFLFLFWAVPSHAAQVHSVLRVSTAPEQLMIRHDQGDGLYLLWVHSEDSVSTLRLQQANFRGRKRWGNEGRVLRTVRAPIELIQMSASEEGVSVIWRESHAENSELWWQHIDSKGHGIQQKIRSGNLKGRMAILVENNLDRVFWQEENNDRCDLVHTVVNYPHNAALLKPVKVITSQAQCDMDPVVANDIESGMAVIWRHQTEDSCQLLAQYFDTDQKPIWESPGIPLTSRCKQPEITATTVTPAHQIIVVWKNHSGMGDEWRAQSLDVGGQRLWSEDGMYLADDANDQAHASVSLNGAGSMTMAWEGTHGDSTKIYMQQWDPSGQPIWGEGGRPAVTDRLGMQLKPVAVGREKGGYVFWRDSYSPPWSLYAQRVDGEGHGQWEGGQRLAFLDIARDPLIALSTAHGSILLVWLEASPENKSWDVKTLLVNAETHSLW